MAALRITPLGGLAGDTWRPWHRQPIYASHGEAAPRASDLVPNAGSDAAATEAHQLAAAVVTAAESGRARDAVGATPSVASA